MAVLSGMDRRGTWASRRGQTNLGMIDHFAPWSQASNLFPVGLSTRDSPKPIISRNKSAPALFATSERMSTMSFVIVIFTLVLSNPTQRKALMAARKPHHPVQRNKTRECPPLLPSVNHTT
jgi:hypothetical protein